MKKNNAKRTVVVIALIALMAIPSMFAYFTDTDSAKNTFVFGDVEIELNETNWEEGEVNYEDAQSVVAGDVIAKDPTVTVNNATPTYVFMKVTQPEDAKYTIGEIGDGWKVLNESTADGKKVTVYYYDTIVKATCALPALFETVSFAETLTEDGLADTTFDIDINAYAIQAETFATADAAWTAAPAEWK
ncbi:MAG: SipW-dependent-type signal peptide-containing protein [Firmicutes bacterium]|nr:SipW-dependent-type signal peptide-containing protein [Bacillota bacterium]